MSESRELKTAADVIALREDEEFHEGAMALLTFPTAPPQAYFSHDNPKFFGGVSATVGDIVTKDDAGNFIITKADA